MNAQPQCPRCGSPRTALDARFCQICGARLVSPEAPSDPLVGAVLLGRYKVISLLGEGGMGRVYLGEQKLGEGTRRVAIKVLASARGNDEYIIARFRREAATIASLTHPNTIRIYDYGEENGRFFSVMEYVSGGSLADVLARGPMDPMRAERIGWQVAGALEEAHRSGIVHRDLKPENILLSRGAGGAEVAKVVDFGIARRPPNQPGEKPLTVTGAVLGTPAFMSPEQFMGEGVDARADVYALALVFFQMVSGALPWRASSVMEWAEKHMREAPATLSSLPQCAAFADRYDPALSHALQKDFKARTADAMTLMRELTGAQSPPEAPLVLPRPLAPTLVGSPSGPMSEPSLGPTPLAPSRRFAPRAGLSPAVMLLFSVGCVVFGYAVVRWALEQRREVVPITVLDASPADAGRAASQPAVERNTPRHAQRLASLRARARNINNLDAVLADYQSPQTRAEFTSAELEPLRADIVATASAEIRRLIGRNCHKAQTIGTKLKTAELLPLARGSYTRACPAP